MESDASIDILEQLKDITECCICSETLRDSRVLPCIHTFCLDCLRRTHSSFASAGNKLPCPICRSEFVVPAGGMDKLPRNFFIERVIEMTKTTTPGIAVQSEGRPTLCDACLDDNGEPGSSDIPSATMQCVECQQNLCDECCKHHRKNKMTRTHRIVALGEQVDQPTESTESEHRVNPGVCQTHLDKPLEIYCSTCQTVTCVKCYFEAHQSHKCSEVAIVVEDLKKQVLTDIQKVSSWASEAKEKLKQLGNRKKEFLSNADALDAVISSRKEELKRLVETQAMALLSQLQTIKQRTIKEIENDKDSLERHIAILESYTLYCNAVNTNGTASDICLGAKELHARAEKLLQLHESFDYNNYSRVEKVLLKTDEPDECLKSCNNIVGKLHVSYKSKQDNECNIQIPEERATNSGSKAGPTSNTKHSDTSSAFCIRLLHRMTSHDQWAMSGITHLGNSIYILSSSSNSIIVHQDKEPFEKLRDIQTKSIKSPVDISSCQTLNCLYITDQKSSCLWRINPSQNDEISKCLSDIGEPYTLSVSNDGCVLMTKSGSPCSNLTIYSPDTDTTRSIELPVEVESPQHAVRTSTGNFIVSYGKRVGKSWNLMEVMADSGQMVRRHEASNTFQQLNGSYHLAIDASDRVIVVDFYNNRVMLLDSKLNWARTLLTKDRHGIHSPKRICFVKCNNQLIVKNRKTVDVYSFQSSSQIHN